MSELESLVKNLSDKFDGLQNNQDKLRVTWVSGRSMGSGIILAAITDVIQGHDLGVVQTTGSGHALRESIEVLYASDLQYRPVTTAHTRVIFSMVPLDFTA